MSSESAPSQNFTCLHPKTGQFWAMPYSSEQIDLVQYEPSTLNANAPGLKNVAIDLNNEKIIDSAKTPRRFERCWLSGKLNDIHISNWVFEQCTFDKSSWHKVKFSKCNFNSCHFFDLSITECAFISSCIFDDNSVSPETIIMKDTMLDANAFISSMNTNLQFLPDATDQSYQKYRLTQTKANAAMMLYSSTKSASNLRYFNAAQKALILAEIDDRIESKRYKEGVSNTNHKDKLRKSFIFILLSIPPRIEKLLIKTAGWLTQWGQSVLYPCIFLLLVTILFGGIYWINDWNTVAKSDTDFYLIHSLVKALNINLVAGFTAYYDPSSPDLSRLMTEFFNLALGIFWYSLIVPIVVKKLLR